MKADQVALGAPPEAGKRSMSRAVALIVAAETTGATIAEHLRRLGMEVHVTPHYGAMAATLFDRPDSHRGDLAVEMQPGVRSHLEILFVIDLRLSCGAPEVDARLADYDAVLHAHMMAGNPWPRTLCLVDAAQTHPAWLQARPHLRATLLADEVETVIGDPRRPAWNEAFVLAVKSCLYS